MHLKSSSFGTRCGWSCSTLVHAAEVADGTLEPCECRWSRAHPARARVDLRIGVIAVYYPAPFRTSRQTQLVLPQHTLPRRLRPLPTAPSVLLCRPGEQTGRARQLPKVQARLSLAHAIDQAHRPAPRMTSHRPDVFLRSRAVRVHSRPSARPRCSR